MREKIMERTCENCEYKYEWVDCIQCCDCSCHNRWKPNSKLSNFAIEELEKIKEEILTQNPKFTIGCEMKMCLEIIDKHISELKGEE